MTSPIKLSVTGLRGIPDIEGGIETHAQNLYPLIAAQGHDVHLWGRRAFTPSDTKYEWGNVSITPTWAPQATWLETIGHSFICTVRQALNRPDILQIHGVGPALVTPLARLLGMRVLVTHHGRTYESDKWGSTAKKLLLLGEILAMRFANRVICVAHYDADRLNRQYNTEKAIAIPNGLPAMEPIGDPKLLDQLGVVPGKYLLHVGRIVPEKRQLDLIEAFIKADLPDWKLLMVGSAMHELQFADDVEKAVASHPNVVSAGHRQGSELSTLYGGAGMFVLPSALEGFSISILEAMGFGLPLLLSDIPGNREFKLPDDTYFPVGDIETLAQKIVHMAAQVEPRDAVTALDIERLPKHLRWDWIADETIRVLQEMK